MKHYARDERAALAATLLQVGPDAATLDEGWVARDLAAHVVLRERRPDAMAGRDAVRRRVRALGWPVLLGQVAAGPPRWSPLAWNPVHETMNLVEFYVHHEDVRRGGVGWSPRELDPGYEQALWGWLRRSAPVLLRSTPGALELRRVPGTEALLVHRRRGEPVRVSGPVQELVLYAYGRTSAARVEVSQPAGREGAGLSGPADRPSAAHP